MSNNIIPTFYEKMIRENYSPLSQQEEDILINLYKQGDRRALSKLINAQMKCIVAIAKAYTDRNSPIEDCIQEGTLAFPKAILDFDPTMGIRFYTFLASRVRASIQVFVFQNDIVRLPMNHVKATKTKKEEKELVDNKPKRADMISIHTPIGDGTATIEDTLQDETESVNERDLSKQIERYTSALDKNTKKWKMLAMFYGINCEPQSLEEIANIFHCTRQLVHLNISNQLKIARKKYQLLEA